MTLLDAKDPLAEADKLGYFDFPPEVTPRIPPIEEVAAVGDVRHVPFGTAEGKPYFSLTLKGGGRLVTVYGHYFESDKLRELTRAIEARLAR